MKEYYFTNRVGFFGTFALYGVLAGLTAILVRGLPVLDPSNLFRVLMIALVLVLARSSSERVHAVFFPLLATILAVFVALFQLRLD